MTICNVLAVNDPDGIPQAIRLLKQDRLIVFPTDTLYGLACSPYSETALAKIYAAKHRSQTKAIPVLISNLAQLSMVARNIPDTAMKLIDLFWPGKLTLVLPRQTTLPDLLSPTDSIAVRMPAHPFALELLETAGPLAVTSANLSDHANHAIPEEILDELGQQIDLFIDGGRLESTTPSTIVDCRTSPLTFLREGAISKSEIDKLCQNK